MEGFCVCDGDHRLGVMKKFRVTGRWNRTSRRAREVRREMWASGLPSALFRYVRRGAVQAPSRTADRVVHQPSELLAADECPPDTLPHGRHCETAVPFGFARSEAVELFNWSAILFILTAGQPGGTILRLAIAAKLRSLIWQPIWTYFFRFYR